MSVARRVFAGSALLAAAISPCAWAAAAETCGGSDAGELAIGTAARIAPGAARHFTVGLIGGQGIIVDLVSLTPAIEAATGADHDQDDDEKPSEPLRDLALCDARGERLAPLSGEVFAKGGSVSALPDGQRLRFVAPAAGRYTIAVSPSDAAREILVRERALGPAGGVAATALGKIEAGRVSSAAPQVFSFTGAAGQWIELKSVSENDTVLHLAGPSRTGEYAQIASNDDSEGLNPVIRRKLPIAGTYFLQVDALGEETKEFTLTLRQVPAPPPPPPPKPLKVGATVRDRLAGSDDAKVYALPVLAGHSYRLELTAPYDGVVAIGLPNPLEPADGEGGPGAGFAEIAAQDAGTSGIERLNFSAREGGQLLVRVKSFGTAEGDGSFTLVAVDIGG